MAGGKKNKKGGRVRTDAQRQEDMRRMLLMIGRGASQASIAKEFGVSIKQISYDYNVILRQATRRGPDRQHEVGAKLIELEKMKGEAWDAWERSKEPAVETIDVNSDNNSSYTEKKRGQCGDTKYLQVIADCIKQERALRGLDAPKEMQMRGQMTSMHLDWSAFMDLDNHDRNLVEERMKLMLEGKPVPPLLTNTGQSAQEPAHELVDYSDNYIPLGEEDE